MSISSPPRQKTPVEEKPTTMAPSLREKLIVGMIGLFVLSAAVSSYHHFNTKTDYDENVIIMCTYELTNGKTAFIIEDQDRQKCEGGTITVWKKAQTITISGETPEAITKAVWQAREEQQEGFEAWLRKCGESGKCVINGDIEP